MTAENKIAWRSAWVAAGFGLFGAALGAGVTAYVNDQNLDAQRAAQKVEADLDRDAKAREQRRPVYDEFIDAANEWATRQATASQCANLLECRYDQSDLDDSRYRFQVAINDMRVYASKDGLVSSRVVIDVLPETLVGSTGSATVDAVDEDDLQAAVSGFHDQMCIDLAYDPEGCAYDY